MKYYAGIGARDLPNDIYKLMEQIAVWLAEENWTLRSGGAKGADTAFETGCDKRKGEKEIFLPEKGYNGNNSEFYTIPDKAHQLANEKWNLAKRNQLIKNLYARNFQQILGANLDCPTTFVICWTKNGKAIGGTGKTIQVAKDFKIPVINLFNEPTLLALGKENFLESLKNIL